MNYEDMLKEVDLMVPSTFVSSPNGSLITPCFDKYQVSRKLLECYEYQERRISELNTEIEKLKIKAGK